MALQQCSSLLFYFSFTLWSGRTAKSTIWKLHLIFFFFLIITEFARVAKIWPPVHISKFQRILDVSFSRKDSGLCIYHLFVWWHFNFLHNFQGIIFLTHSYLLLDSFDANLLHSLEIWLIVPSLSPNKLYLLFSCVFYHYHHYYPSIFNILLK